MTIGGNEMSLPTVSHSSIFCMAVSSDGNWKATGNANVQVYLYEGSTILADPIHDGDVSALGFSASGKWLVTGGENGMVKVWDVASRRLLYSFKGHLGRVQAVRFSADESTVASANDDGATRVWNLLPIRSPRVFGTHEQPIFSVAYSPDGKYLAVGTGNPSVLPHETGHDGESSGGVVKIWEVHSGELAKTFRVDDWRVLALAFTKNRPDDSRLGLITGGYASQIRVWDALADIKPKVNG